MSDTVNKPIEVECIIFDLDDTLIKTCIFYDQKRQEAFEAMKSLASLDITHAQAELEVVEHAQIQKLGFAKERFPLSLGLTYQRLCAIQGRRVDPYIQHKIEGVGWSVYETEHPLMDDVHEVLGALRYAGYNLFCFTKGDDEIQTAKLHRARLAEYFHQIIVVPDKTPFHYTGLAEMHGLTPVNCVMIGDSVKSDINPACEAGFHAVHIPSEHVWGYEVADAKHPYHVVNDLDALLDFFNARWALEKNYQYKMAPHTDLLRAVRDGKLELHPDTDTAETMPNCPGVIYRFIRQEDGFLQEWKGVFEPETRVLAQVGNQTVTQKVPVKQWASTGFVLPDHLSAQENQNVFRAMREESPGALCATCENRTVCISQGIIAGVLRSE